MTVRRLGAVAVAVLLEMIFLLRGTSIIVRCPWTQLVPGRWHERLGL